MKYLMLLYWLVLAVSCAPKYTASFQDYRKPPHHDYPVITTQHEEVIVNDTPLGSAMLPEEMTASAVNKPKEFKRAARIDLLPDTIVTAKQDTILLKNGDKIVGQITEVTSNKLVCKVSSWRKVNGSLSKKEIKESNQVIYLDDVFLIKYANGNKETVNFSMKQDPASENKINKKNNPYAIMGFVFGILSIFPIYGTLLSIPAIVLSIQGMKREKRKLARVGLVMGIVGLILGVAFIIYYLYIMLNLA